MRNWIPFAVAVAIAAPATRAEASYIDYCGGLVPARSWCWSNYLGDAGLIDWNRARYPASSCIGVGIMLYRNFTRTYHDEHHACRYVASSNLGLKGQALVANDSTNRHTVEGMLNLCWGCVLSRVDVDAIRASAEVIAPAVAQLGALRRPAEERDALPSSVISGLLDSGSELDARSARRANVAGRAEAYYVVPGADVCLFREQADAVPGTCAPATSLEAGELYVVSSRTDDLAPGMARISGVVPDGVTSVRVRLGDGEARELAVSDNVYVGELAGDGAAPPVIELLRRPLDEAAPEPEPAGCQAGRSTGAGLVLLAALGLRRRKTRPAARA